MGIVQGKLILRYSRRLCIKIKHSDFDIIRNSKFVTLQKDYCTPIGVEVVEGTAGMELRGKSTNKGET